MKTGDDDDQKHTEAYPTQAATTEIDETCEDNNAVLQDPSHAQLLQLLQLLQPLHMHTLYNSSETVVSDVMLNTIHLKLQLPEISLQLQIQTFTPTNQTDKLRQ